jgi:hypothetical protein
MADDLEKKPGMVVPSNNASDQLPTELLDRTAADAGKGVSLHFEDQLTPLIYILQSNSPACDQRGTNYIDGATPGDFLLRGAVDPIRSGVEGIEVIPCDMKRVWMEWLPARGGYASCHASRPDDAKQTLVSEGGREKQQLIRSNGNVIEETRQYFVLVEGRPYVLGCASTKNTFAKSWNTYASQFRHPQSGEVMPAFSRRYRLTTVQQANPSGRWFGPKFQDLGWVSVEEYAVGRGFYETIKQGLARAEPPRDL